MKHKGSFEDLKTMVRGVGREITFAGMSGNAHQIKTEDGAILNWYESISDHDERADHPW